MEKHVLVTTSDDLSKLYGVRFICSFFEKKSDLKVTLFYVTSELHPERGGDGRVLHTSERCSGPIAQEKLDAGKRFLHDKGFPSQQVLCKIMSKQFGTIKDIIREGKAGYYDAVVLGRRGYNVFESILSSSVSREMMDQDITFPIWICRHPDEGRKNVLLCVDGSDSSLRIADHVGFMLGDESKHTITIFQVETGDGADLEGPREEARKVLMDNGVPAERIKTRVRSARKPAEAIMQETKEGAYAVVAVGRVGKAKSGLKQWLVGSTSLTLLDDLEKAVLWVSK
jgi:nucleotide-binding universal stress UspA family protein